MTSLLKIHIATSSVKESVSGLRTPLQQTCNEKSSFYCRNCDACAFFKSVLVRLLEQMLVLKRNTLHIKKNFVAYRVGKYTQRFLQRGHSSTIERRGCRRHIVWEYRYVLLKLQYLISQYRATLTDQIALGCTSYMKLNWHAKGSKTCCRYWESNEDCSSYSELSI